MSKLILDACCNHLGVNAIQEQMIIEADHAKAEYIKFQLYDSEKLNPKYPNFTETKRRLQRCELGLLDVTRLIEVCRPRRIIPMFTIFDIAKIEWFVLAFQAQKFALKVASPDMADHELINKLVKSCPKTEIFVSCGMHYQEEIESIREMFDKYTNIKWLYCVSMYPTPIDIIDIEDIKNYDGLSDHSIGLEAIRKVAATNPDMGYYEKHFTLSRQLPIVDRDWSVVPDELKELKAILTYGEDCIKYKNRWKR